MKENYKNFNKNIHVITNGFDGELSDSKSELDEKFTLTHVGMMNADRNPKILWLALAELTNENAEFASDLQIKLIGKVADDVIKSIHASKLEGKIQFINYIPHHEVMDYQRSAQVLLLPVNNVPSVKGIITGKIFEYLQAKRPIIAIAPLDGDLAEIINSTNSGIVVDFEDKEKLKNSILDFYKRYKENDLNTESKNIKQYHRKNITKQLVDVINNIK
ncbi:MAG: glycosyltransferase [Flavobacteriaceae bacterium]|nr:glycosyltransferase [Flavobacteriaceae bacterium]